MEVSTNNVSKYVSHLLSFLLGIAGSIFWMYESNQEIRESLVKYDVVLHTIEKYIEQDAGKLILPGAAIRVAALETAAKKREHRIEVLEEFRIQGGRFTAKQGKELAEGIRTRLERLEDKIDKLSTSGATIEFRLFALEQINEKPAKR